MRRFLLLLILITALLTTNSYAFMPVIDPGHGGEDGGAVSNSGIIESSLNLEISKKLKLTFCLFGIEPVILRETDISLHGKGADTIRKKKISDLKNRVATINAVPNAFLISIHQNSFTDSRYSGAQVFYKDNQGEVFAEFLRDSLRTHLDPNNNRDIKKAPRDIYVLSNINCPAVLVECGFLTNARELERLQNPIYQQKLALIIALSYINYIQSTP